MNILEEANKIVSGERNTDYGHPADDFQKTADMWTVILGVPVTTQQVALCMIAVKISRLLHEPKRDSLVDIAGYARTIEMLWEKDQAPEPGAIQRLTDQPNCPSCLIAFKPGPAVPGVVVPMYIELHELDCERLTRANS